MIAREDFINKLKSFNYDNEQITKCLAYYDNSNSKNKKDIVEHYDSKRLIGVVNRWYGIVTSTKKPNIKKPLLSANLCDILNKLGKYKQPFYELFTMINNETDSSSLLLLINQSVNLNNNLSNKTKSYPILDALLETLSNYANTKFNELLDPTLKERRIIYKMIEELNKKNPTSEYIYSLEMKKKSDTET